MSVHTKDIGIAIRDALDGMCGSDPIETFDWTKSEIESLDHVYIENVDASDANNLLITMEDGSQFRVCIIREG